MVVVDHVEQNVSKIIVVAQPKAEQPKDEPKRGRKSKDEAE